MILLTRDLSPLHGTPYATVATRKDLQRAGALLAELETSRNADLLKSFSDKGGNGVTLLFYAQLEVDPLLAHKATLNSAAAEVQAVKDGGEGGGASISSGCSLYTTRPHAAVATDFLLDRHILIFQFCAEAEAKGAAEEDESALVPVRRLKVVADFMPEDAFDLEAVYFIKNTDKALVTEGDVVRNCDTGVLTGNSLLNLSEMLSNVFIPILDMNQESAAAEETSGLEVNDTALRNEFRNGLQKFGSQVSHAIQQVSGDIHLQIPDINIDDPGAVTDDYETVQILESALEEWTKAITSVVEQEQKKTPQGSGPLAEIEFWRRRNATLSAMFEQINMPRVKKMIEVLDLVESNGMPTYKFQVIH